MQVNRIGMYNQPTKSNKPESGAKQPAFGMALEKVVIDKSFLAADARYAKRTHEFVSELSDMLNNFWNLTKTRTRANITIEGNNVLVDMGLNSKKIQKINDILPPGAPGVDANKFVHQVTGEFGSDRGRNTVLRNVDEAIGFIKKDYKEARNAATNHRAYYDDFANNEFDSVKPKRKKAGSSKKAQTAS